MLRILGLIVCCAVCYPIVYGLAYLLFLIWFEVHEWIEDIKWKIK